MIIAYLIIFLILLILLGVYFYFYLLRTVDFWRQEHKTNRVKILAIFLILCVILWFAKLIGFSSLIIVHIIILDLCMQIINFIIRSISHINKDSKTNLWNKIFRCGLVPIIMTILIIGYGYYNMKNVIETDYTIHTEKPIQKQGYRIAMIADLHFGTTINEDKLKTVCNKIQRKNPDLVVLCGDIVDEKTTLKQMENAISILGGIKSKYGTFYIYGNHDKDTYASKPNFREAQLKSNLLNNNIKVLENKVYDINKELTIIGREDRGFSSEFKRESTKDLLQNVNTNKFLLLLDHQPVDFKENIRVGIDLQLSGHTHGGQIWPLGLLNKITKINDLNYGYEKISKFQAIVTSGIGGWGYPIRTESHSEFVILDLK